ncbi:MAG: hypothetical protein K1X89_06625 [Myxococcaceae bacterium]|nr:hypothetical protein [Myxococcaceae bacterium]
MRRFFFAAIIFGVVLAVFAAPLTSVDVPVGDRRQAEPPRDQQEPAVALSPSGNRAVAAWTDGRFNVLGDRRTNIVVAFFDQPNATSWTQYVVAPSPFTQSEPAVVVGNGVALVVWTQYRDRLGNETAIMGALLPMTGARTGAQPFVVRDVISTIEQHPAVSYRNGVFSVAYQSINSIDYIQVLEADGGLQNQTNVAPGPNTDRPQIASLSATTDVITWTDIGVPKRMKYATVTGTSVTQKGNLAGNRTNNLDQYALALTGTTAGATASWQEYYSPSQLNLYVARIDSTGALTDPNGILVAVDAGLQSASLSSNGLTTYLVYGSSIGAGFGYKFATISNTGAVSNSGASLPLTGPGGSFDLAVNTSGATLLGYTENRNGTNTHVYQGFYGSSFNQLMSAGLNAQEGPAIATTQGVFGLAWADWRGDDAGFDVMFQRISSDGGLLDPSPIAIERAPGDQRQVAITASTAGNFLVGWVDRSTGFVMGKRVSASGTVLDPTSAQLARQNVALLPRGLAFDGTNYVVLHSHPVPAFKRVNWQPRVSRVNQAGISIDDGGVVVYNASLESSIGSRGGAIASTTTGSSLVAVNVHDFAGDQHVVVNVGGRSDDAGYAIADAGALGLSTLGNTGFLLAVADVLDPTVVSFFELDTDAGIRRTRRTRFDAGISAISVASDGVNTGLAFTAQGANGINQLGFLTYGPDGGVLAEDRLASPAEEIEPQILFAGARRAVVAVTRLDDLEADAGAPRVRAKFVPFGALGIGCTFDTDCASNLCDPVEKVCCDRACNSGACESCLGVSGAQPGTCAFSPTTRICRPSAGVCDPAETCTGASATCPSIDVKAQVGTVCRASDAGCDRDEVCDGLSNGCPPVDAISDAGTVCQSTQFPCANPGLCDGLTKECPASPGVQPTSHVCRPALGFCDLEEKCDGVNNTCPDDLYASTGICRDADGGCDVAESCQGNSPQCPPDAVASAMTSCNDQSNRACAVGGRCNGVDRTCPAVTSAPATVVCRQSSSPCLSPTTCSGTGLDCPDGFTPTNEGMSCGDGLTCQSGECKAPPVITGPTPKGSRYGFGCGCGAGSDGLVLPLALLAFLWSRRRVRLGGAVLGLLVAMVSTSALAADAPKRLRLVFNGLDNKGGLSEEAKNSVSEFVQSEVASMNAYEVIGRTEIAAIIGVDRQRQLLGCSADSSSCMEELGGAINAERMLIGDVSRVDETVLLNLSLIDLTTSKPIARIGRKIEKGGTSALLEQVKPGLYELANQDPTYVSAPLKMDRGFGGVVLGVRGDTDVLGPRIAPVITAELSGRWAGGAISVIPKASVGVRLEGRFYPVVIGRVRPYVAAGATGFTTGLGVRGALGAAVRFSSLQIFADVAYERFVASFSPSTESYQDNAVLLGVGAGWQF